MERNFNMHSAFGKNLGWITSAEAITLSNARVAIAGMGGVGGSHLITLIRLGISKFHIADFDHFELSNFNRQYGADTATLGLKKTEVMIQKALSINPEARIKNFENGITEENIEQFLENVDIFVDGLDVFTLDLREKIFMKCYEKNIPAITVAPIGMGASVINFLPGKMSFKEYFNFKINDNYENFFKFIIGLSPSLIQLKSMVEKSFTNVEQQNVPSTPMGCFLASGMMGTEVLKVLLKRKNTAAAPFSIHFDAYTYKLKKKYMLLGHLNPIYRIKIFLAKRISEQNADAPGNVILKVAV